jgi:hypothetical protein
MASEPTRDPAKDHLLTPRNSALMIVDYQPVHTVHPSLNSELAQEIRTGV